MKYIVGVLLTISLAVGANTNIKKVTANPYKDAISAKTVFINSAAKQVGDSVGYTFYDWQANRNRGKSIQILPGGGIHVTWMGRQDTSAGDRDMLYAYYDGTAWYPYVTSSPGWYCGYGEVDYLSDYSAIIVKHGGDVTAGALVSVDDAEGLGTFGTQTFFDTTYDWIWPRIAVYRSGNRATDVIYVTMSGYSLSGIAYSKSTDGGATFLPAKVILDTIETYVDTVGDTITTITYEPDIEHPIAVDPNDPNKVAAFYLEDIYWTSIIAGTDTVQGEVYEGVLLQSTDGGTTWNEILRVDQNFFANHGYGEFTDIYLSHLPYYLPDGRLVTVFDAIDTLGRGGIFFYDVTNDILSLVDMGVENLASDTIMEDSVDVGYNILRVGHPQLSYDPATGKLFVVYIKFLTDDYVAALNAYVPYLSCGEVFVSASFDNGATWTTPENLTNTFNVDERYASVSPYVYNNTLAVSFEEDLSVGASVFGQGEVTPNPIRVLLVDSRNISVDEDFTLNKPAFSIKPVVKSGSITIKFSREINGDLSVDLYNVAGRKINVFKGNVNGDKLNLNIGDLPQGVYFIKLSGAVNAVRHLTIVN